jgi:hypothetical protein
VTPENVSDRLVGNGIAEIRKRSDDSVVAPAGVLFRHPDNEFHDFSGKWRTAGAFALLRSIKLLGDESTVPGENRLRLGNYGNF